MKLDVVLFAALREAFGSSRLTVTLEGAPTGSALRDHLAREHPRWRDLIHACRLAQGVEFLDEDTPLSEGSEIVLIPPVSGGGDVAPSGDTVEGTAPPRVRLTREPLSGNALKQAAIRPGSGAVTLFEGTVRTPSMGKDVVRLEYEAYEEMALAQMERIVTETEAGWPGVRAYLHHRLGPLAVGEASVVAVASAPHRGESFEACRNLIERLKHDVPIWKKEIFTDGTVWVGAPGECAHDAEPDPADS